MHMLYMYALLNFLMHMLTRMVLQVKHGKF